MFDDIQFFLGFLKIHLCLIKYNLKNYDDM